MQPFTEINQAINKLLLLKSKFKFMIEKFDYCKDKNMPVGIVPFFEQSDILIKKVERAKVENKNDLLSFGQIVDSVMKQSIVHAGLKNLCTGLIKGELTME